MKGPRTTRQVLIGLVALPLSLLPFLAYLTWTPEGRLVRDRVLVAVNPPTLPRLSAEEIRRGVVPRYGGAVMVLGYHGVGSQSDGEGGFVVSPKRFGEHLVAMKRAGMNPVTATEVADAFVGGKPLPSRAVMITFDDGRTDAMLFADPLLKQARMKATMFVITSAAEDPGVYYSGWGRLEQAARSGRWELQAHTHDHHRMQDVNGTEFPALTSLAAGESIGDYRKRVRADFADSDRLLNKHTGEDPVAFAYPFGAYGADRTNDDGVRAVLKSEVARTYHIAFHQDEQESVPLATPYDERTSLRRLEVADWTAKQLMQKIAASASRSAAAVETRKQQLEADLAAGNPLPQGVAATGQPPDRAAVRTRRSAPAASGTAAPAPQPGVAGSPAAGYTQPQPTPPQRTNHPPAYNWTPPDDDPPAPEPPPPSKDATPPPDPGGGGGGGDGGGDRTPPGQSADRPGNGNGNGGGGDNPGKGKKP